MKSEKHATWLALYILGVMAFFGMLNVQSADAALMVSPTTGHSAGSIVVRDMTVKEQHLSGNGSGVGIYTLTFSLTAFGNDVFVPLSVQRMDAGRMSTSSVGFVLEDRARRPVQDGIALGVLIPEKHGPVNGLYRILEGETEEFTLLVVYVDIPQDDYEARVRVTNFPMQIGDKAPLFLSTGELGSLKTKYAEFYP